MPAYRTKTVERIHLPAREERERALSAAGYNLFNLASEDVYVDLLTDSGTGAMSDAQWAALLAGDEAYAGSRSFEALRSAVEDVMGVSSLVPAHQGRGAENVLYGSILSDGDVSLSNAHFDTTRAHVSHQGAEPIDCPLPDAMDPAADGRFKGNFSIETARDVVEDVGADAVTLVVLTITNNSVGGQPVSLANVAETADFAAEIDATFVVDACRFAENAHFVREREPGQRERPIPEIAREQLARADAVVMSGKKDGLANVGGFVATDDEDLLSACKQRAILYEGFPTYGGMAGRDLAAMAVGLREAVEPAYLRDRIEQVQTLGEGLDAAGVPHYRPTGGHAVYIDAGSLLSHVPAHHFPDQALACALYLEGGVRGVALGSFAFPDADRPELVRLALPRRTYHREHLEHVVETAARVLERREEIGGYRIVEEPPNPSLRHFSATLEPVEPGE